MRNKRFEELTNNLQAEKDESFMRAHLELLGWAYTKEHRESDRRYLENHEYRYEKLLASIPTISNPLRVLDIGTTAFTFFIKEIHPHYKVATLDLTSLWEGICKTRGIEFQKHNLSEHPLPFESDNFDIVIFTETLEHLVISPTELLREIHRIITPGGRLLFSVPNLATLVNRIKLLWGISPLPNADDAMGKKKSIMYGHVREYTMKECVFTLQGCGFAIMRKEFFNLPITRSFRISRNIGSLILRLLYGVACILVPSFGATIFIEASKPKHP